MSDWKDRLLEEREMLNDKIKKLNILLSSAEVNNINTELLSIQYTCMLSYLKVLELRIKEL